ncbi:hypothetical protein MTO96_019018 [Rhipicephalus appendiculatus]
MLRKWFRTSVELSNLRPVFFLVNGLPSRYERTYCARCVNTFSLRTATRSSRTASTAFSTSEPGKENSPRLCMQVFLLAANRASVVVEHCWKPPTQPGLNGASLTNGYGTSKTMKGGLMPEHGGCQLLSALVRREHARLLPRRGVLQRGEPREVGARKSSRGCASGGI